MKPLLVDGKPIAISKEARYLGVILDRKLSFKCHILHKIEAARAHATILNNRVKASHGPIPELIRGVYRSIMLAKMNYGCHVFQHKLTNELITKLTRLNVRGAAAMCNVFPHTGHCGITAKYPF